MKETGLKAFKYADDIMLWGEDVKELETGKSLQGIQTGNKSREDSNVKTLKK
jgi:hypothetical protein